MYIILLINYNNKMYKQTQYLSNESFKPFRNTTDN